MCYFIQIFFRQNKTYNFIFQQAVHCVLRWFQGSNRKRNSILAGLLAGASIGFYRNTTLILYLTWKTLEVLYYEGVKAGCLVNVPGFASFLYSLSTSILFHAGKK